MVTKESTSLIELTEKHANTDFMRELGKWTLHRLMELEVGSQISPGANASLSLLIHLRALDIGHRA